MARGLTLISYVTLEYREKENAFQVKGNPRLAKTGYTGMYLQRSSRVLENSTYLLFCTSVSNKCLEMKMYSTPSLSWLRFALVVSVVDRKGV